MRTFLFALVTTATILAGSVSAQQACVVADSSCKESFAVGQFNFWYFRSFSLQTPNPNITRAVIVMHGMERDAPVYFQAVVDALQNAKDSTLLVLAPHFKGFVRTSPTCNDPLEEGELHWSCTGSPSINRWDDGGQARDVGSEVVYSFSMIDRLLDTLNDPSLFPNLRKITITGHSDGAQFTQRYAAGSQKDGAISAAVKYVIANPGSYMYLDNRRLPAGETCFADGTCTADFTPNWDSQNACAATYNNYKYGLDARTFGYMSSDRPGFSDDELRTRFISRNAAYLMGENDQSGLPPLDVSCPATAQGSHTAEDGSGFVGGRRERGTIFWNYMLQLGATQTLTIVPVCGHSGGCMYGAQETIQAILF
jgi:pimeloyl-ACP methyl ester carboxylesterase